jgi:hypothetical protein
MDGALVTWEIRSTHLYTCTHATLSISEIALLQKPVTKTITQDKYKNICIENAARL